MSVYGDPSWLYGHTFASGTKDIREKIADALDRRTDEVVSSVLSAVINGAGGRPTDRVLDSQADYARQGTGLMARWIRTGRAASHEELADIGPIRREAASVTGQVTRMVRANLAFRDGVMAIVRDEVSRLGAPLELLLGLSAGVDFGFRLNLLQIGRVFDRRSQAYEDELAAKEAELAHQALHDPLTGLANRALMFDRLDQACERLRRHPARGGVGVIFIDLDDFKAVNDCHGHAAGDAVLAEAGRRLVATVRPEDTVA
ncbi:MAG: diguanylate cyclase domain-containing protein, partial [Acidimicrobiales bacterium]